MPALQKLFEPITIRGLQLKNRYLMPAMVTNYAETDGKVTQRLIDYHVARARGGVALNFVEAAYVRADGRGFINEVGVHNDAMVPGLKRLVDEVHAAGGKIGLQIYHAGRQTSSLVSGHQPIAPSAVCCPVVQEMPRELPTAEVKQLVNDFGEAARRAKEAGFDAVELHGAHGYLIAQFLSPFSNRRLDEYGGGLLGRARFGIEVIRRIRQAVGHNYPIFMRISGDEYVEGGQTLTLSRALVPFLIEAGVDALHVSAGNYATPGGLLVAPMNVDEATLVPLAASIKKVSSVPVAAVDRLHNPILAEQVLQQGKADLIGIGRALLTDPELPNKAQRGDLEDILLCISCNQACIANLLQQKSISCLLNPACGREADFAIKQAQKPKKVMVLGGGPAGMETARLAALRGHDVTLVDENSHLGGKFAVASRPPRKEELADSITWMIRHVKSAGVKVELGTKATPDFVAQRKPDVAVIATGSRPKVPKVPGIDRPEVVSATDLLVGKVGPGARVLIIGGGLTGLDVAEFAAVQGKSVTIIEMLDTVASDLEAYRRYWQMKSLAEHDVCIFTNTTLREITDQGVKVEIAGQEQNLGLFDTIVVSVGYAPNGQDYAAISNSVAEVYTIGDAKDVRQAVEAIYEAGVTARQI